MSRVKVAVLTESPDDCQRTWSAIEHIMEPLGEDYKVTRLSVLGTDPKNGKAATKTEIRNADEVKGRASKFKYVILVGNAPLQLITGAAGISRMRGKPFKQGRTFYLPMNNPSILKHDPNQEVVMENDLNLFHDIIEFGGIPEEKELSIKLILNRKDFKKMLKDLRGVVSWDIETNTLNPWQKKVPKKVGGKIEWVDEPAKIVSMGFGTRKHQYVILFDHPNSTHSRADLEYMVDELTEIMEDLIVVAQNGKFDATFLWVHFGVKWRIDFDTMLAHFMIDENSRHGLKYLAQTRLGAPDWEVDLDVKKGASVEKHIKYLAHDLYYTRLLRKGLLKDLRKDEEVKAVFDHIMMPAVNLFVEIEYDGVFVDETQFHEAETVLRKQYDEALARLKEWEPRDCVDSRGRPTDFNWGSTKQLADLLYNRLKLPIIEKTPTGNPACGESVIKRLSHPCTSDLLQFRKAKQQLSFFIDGWKPYLDHKFNGAYLHPSFKLHGTVTGRLSCENPNLQQVPRDPRIRTLLSAPKGWTMIEWDLSQAELRVAAELAGEKNMLYAFSHGIDVHWMTAIQEIGRAGALKKLVMGTAKEWIKQNPDKKPNEKLTYSTALDLLLKMGHGKATQINKKWKEYRKKAKAINFGYLYGMWWKKFKEYARDNYGVDVTDQEAEASRIAFFENYPDLAPWHNRQKAFVRRHGYVASLSGRKRRLPAAMARENTPERKAAERQAINSPVQSFASELNIMAALQLRKEYGRDKVRIGGAVHDAVLARVKNEYVEEVYLRMLKIMEHPELMDTLGIDISVPIESDGEIGPWGAGVELPEWKEAQNV